jgi:hypothetical protein
LGGVAAAKSSVRKAAIASPCDLASAVLGAARASEAASHAGKWTASPVPACGDRPLRTLPVVVTLMPDKRELIGWEFACPSGGPTGPKPARGKRVEFYDLTLTARDAASLSFELTPHYVEFDGAGKKSDDVVQSCAALKGSVALDEPAAEK